MFVENVFFFIFVENEMLKWAVEIKEGKILSIVKEEDWQGKSKLGHIVDYEEAVVMPGLIDV